LKNSRKIKITDRTSLGDRIKGYEKAYISQRAMPLLPVIARLDGKSFHTWTKGLDRPFDEDFLSIMQNTTKKLIEETGACIGYTQSDEITLIFYSANTESQIFFDGKLHKMTSVLASMCTAYFNEMFEKVKDVYVGKLNVMQLSTSINNTPEFKKAQVLFDKPIAIFDCRVFQVPTKDEAVNCLIWREQDAVRNSILSVAQTKFSHKEMHGKSTAELQEMMFQKDGTNWNDFAPHLKRGCYFQKVISERKFTTKEIDKLPPKHEARTNPDLIVTRTDVRVMTFPRLTQITNRTDVVFDGHYIDYPI